MSLPPLTPEPRFLGSFPTADASLDPPLPEIAFVGRSNVGKSSLLNALVGRRIARVSATPGKTRTMNVYVVSGRWPVASAPPPTPTDHRSLTTDHASTADHRPLTTGHSFYLLDLPGYGYSRASKSERAAHAKLLQHALRRPGLTGVVWLLDIRHEPSDADRAMQDLFAGAATRVLVAVTKGDKLPRGRRLAQERALRATLALDDDQVVLTSARTGDGVAELREAIAAFAEAGRR